MSATTTPDLWVGSDGTTAETVRAGHAEIVHWSYPDGEAKVTTTAHAVNHEIEIETDVFASPAGYVFAEVTIPATNGRPRTELRLFLSPAQAVNLGNALLRAGVEAVVGEVLA